MWFHAEIKLFQTLVTQSVIITYLVSMQ